MTRAAALALLLLLATPALADCDTTLIPPQPYDHVPTRPFIDHRLPYWDIDSACRVFEGLRDYRGRLEGCVIPGRVDGVPLRIVPSDLPVVEVACIIRHEDGHLNTGRSDHEGWGYE
jgi:hypothetical protein